MNALAWVLTGAAGTGLVVVVVAVVLIKFNSEDSDPAADALWAEPWPPGGPPPTGPSTPTPAEQVAIDAAPQPAVTDVDELIREVEDLIRRKARP